MQLPSNSDSGSSVAPRFRFSYASQSEAQGNKRTIITIRRQVSSMEDARFVVHGLRDGHAQIVYISGANEESALRVLDFLRGATEALDGECESLGPQIYLFSPSNVNVEVDISPTVTLPSQLHLFGQ